jgi:cell division protein ZapA (FtsZ GTPase activity inhibitor)
VQVRQVTLQLAGQTLRVRTDSDEQALEALVSSVENQLRAVAGTSPISDGRVMLLALMAMSQENTELRARLSEIASRIDAFADDALSELKPNHT